MKIYNKSAWKKVKLGDICDLRNGVAIKSEDYVIISNTLNCRMSNIRPDGTFDILYNAKYLPDNFLEKYKNYLLKDGDLVIAMTDMAGDPKILGVPTVVKSDGFNIIQNQRVGKLELLTKNIDENYLKLALQSKKVKNYFKKFSAGGVQLNLSKKEILNAPIILPTIQEQKELVSLFKIIENFIHLRKEELVNLHFLNKSLFTRMFGDIKTNDKNWEIIKLEKYINIIGGYAFKNTDFKSKGIPLIRIGNINSGHFKNTNLVFIEENQKFEKFKVFPNDIIISLTGTVGKDDYGNVCILGDSYSEYYLNQRNAKLVLTDKINKNFFLEIIKIKEVKKKLTGISRGIRQANISNRDIYNLSFPLPPIELQNKFAERVEKIEKLSFIFDNFIISRTFRNLYKKVSA
mgnify:FL=1